MPTKPNIDYWRLRCGASPWAECTCPRCGAKPVQFCAVFPRLTKRFPWLRTMSVTWFHDHDERIIAYIMKEGLD